MDPGEEGNEQRVKEIKGTVSNVIWKVADDAKPSYKPAHGQIGLYGLFRRHSKVVICGLRLRKQRWGSVKNREDKFAMKMLTLKEYSST